MLPNLRSSRGLRSGYAGAFAFFTLFALTVGCSAESSPGEQAAATESSPLPPDSVVAAPAAEIGGPPAGRYGCAESIPRLVGGSYEYESEGRGFLSFDGRGGYVDPFGVKGTYRYDAAGEESHFAGGALDGAVVTPLEGDGPRLWVVIPTESGERRWSCSLTEQA